MLGFDKFTWVLTKILYLIFFCLEINEENLLDKDVTLSITALTSVNTNIYFFDAFVFVQGYTRYQILLASVSLLNKALCYQKSGLPFALIIASIFGFFCSKPPLLII